MFSEQMIIQDQPEFCPVRSSGAAASLDLPGSPSLQLDDSPDTSSCQSREEDHQVIDSCLVRSSGAAATLDLPGSPPSRLDNSPDTSSCHSCEEDHQVIDSCNI